MASLLPPVWEGWSEADWMSWERCRSQVWNGHRIRVELWADVVELVRYTRAGVPLGLSCLRVAGYPVDLLVSQVWLEVIEMLRKPEERVVAGGTVKSVTDAYALKKWPTLFAYLTAATWPDGTKRTPSSCTFFERDGAFTMLLKDKDAKLCCWVSSSSLLGLWDAMEGALNDKDHIWKRDREEPGQEATRVKRPR